jgi:DNA-binding transcriptional MerR regulator/methylmalonyl-CoA mutase cobalamin-binding subunit
MNKKHIYPIRYVSQRTNLTPHVIRAWEKRYQAVVPHRSPKNRRLYSEDDLQRLQLLKKITDAGHNISQVASLDAGDLLVLAKQERLIAPRMRANRLKQAQPMAVDEHLKNCLSAVLDLDSESLERSYDRAAIDLTRPVLLNDIIVPLFEEIGTRWRNGSLKILNEHMATSVTRNFLLNMLRATEISDSAPKILIATTVGQWHDIGALAVALTAAENGWYPIYYGPNLPAEEIALGVQQNAARVLAISITHLLDQHPLIDELRKLRRYVGRNTALFIGGQIVGELVQILEEVNAIYISEISQFREELNSLLSARGS